MKREERKLLKDHLALSDQLIISINVFGEYFRHKPIGFETLPMLVQAQNFLTSLRVYSHKNKDKLKYAPRKKKEGQKMKNAFDIVRDFENAVAKYTGAPYCVAVNSCTNALFLALKYKYLTSSNVGDSIGNETITIPRFTYTSVPMQIIHAGFKVDFKDEQWRGEYRLDPYNIWDSARRFRADMWFENGPTKCYDVMGTKYKCVSFHWTKILGLSQGGAIIHNDQLFDEWARRARFDGRTAGVSPKYDNPIMGWHMYMSPEIAAHGLVKLMHLPSLPPDLPNDDYADLSKLEIFK